MKYLFLALAGILITTPALAADYEIDPSHTYPHFKINHLGFSTMHGRFDKTRGTLSLDLKKQSGSVEIHIDANSINTGHKKRDEHLRSPDFLNAAEFPDITFKSTKVVFHDNNRAKVTGKLTMIGVSKTVSLDVQKISCGTHPFNKKEVCGFDAIATIKRSDFGSRYGLPGVGDEMQLTFEVEAFKK